MTKNQLTNRPEGNTNEFIHWYEWWTKKSFCPEFPCCERWSSNKDSFLIKIWKFSFNYSLSADTLSRKKAYKRSINLCAVLYSTHVQNHGLPTEPQPFDESTVLCRMNCLKTDLSVSKLSCLFLSTAKCDYCMVEAQSLTMKWIKQCGQTSSYQSLPLLLLEHLYSYSHDSPFSWLFVVSSVLQHPYVWLTSFSALYTR